MSKIKNIILTSLMFVFFAVGIVAFIYPLADEQLYSIEQDKIIEEFDKTFETEPTETVLNKNPKDTAAQAPDLNKLQRDVKAYNKRIYAEGQSNLKDKSSYQTAPLNLYDYGFPNNIYGYISIDKLELNMALYLGASEYNMSVGAACMAQTSIPFGGKNTNTVIAGHCGYGGRHYFRYIENLEPGDIVKVTTPFKRLTYKVSYKKKIDPNNIEQIKIQDGKDMITLFTCYPYPTSDYRICVFCEAVPPVDGTRR